MRRRKLIHFLNFFFILILLGCQGCYHAKAQKIGLKSDSDEVKFAYASGGGFWMWLLPPIGFVGGATYSVGLKSKKVCTENRALSLAMIFNPTKPFEFFRIGANDETAITPWKHQMATDPEGDFYVTFDPDSKYNNAELNSKIGFLFLSVENEIPAEGRVVVWKRLGKDSYVPALTILPNHEFIFHETENSMENE